MKNCVFKRAGERESVCVCVSEIESKSQTELLKEKKHNKIEEN